MPTLTTPSRTAAELESAHLLPTYGDRPLMVERGEGCYVFDAEGNRYLDFITGIGVNALGYGHPAILTALREQAELCLHTSNLHMHRYQGELASVLARWSGLDRVFLSNRGKRQDIPVFFAQYMADKVILVKALHNNDYAACLLVIQAA